MTALALAFPLCTARVVPVPVPDTWGTGTLMVVVFVMADPSPSGDGPKGEPDETGGTPEHVIALVEVVVPVGLPVVVWHMNV